MDEAAKGSEAVKWWNDITAKFDLRYSAYKVDQTEVIIAGRPDSIDNRHLDKTFIESVDAWLSVTDRFIEYPVTRYQWFPWQENGPPQNEVLYGSLKTLHYWIDKLKLKRIYIHCDAGTHRSPSVFGAYLCTYHAKLAQQICEAGTHFRDYPSSPYQYWLSYLVQYPALSRLCNRIRDSEDSEWGSESLESVLRYL